MDTTSILGIEMHCERKPTKAEELIIKDILRHLLESSRLDKNHIIPMSTDGLDIYEGCIYASAGEVTICIWHKLLPSKEPFFFYYEDETKYNADHEEWENKVVSTPIFHMQMDIRELLRKLLL